MRKTGLVVIVIVGAMLCCLALLICWAKQEIRAQSRKSQTLVERKATKQEVISVLGTNYLNYIKGDQNWKLLSAVLEKESLKGHLGKVRNNLSNSQEILSYSTPDVMTWIFLDEHNKVFDFWVSSQ